MSGVTTQNPYVNPILQADHTAILAHLELLFGQSLEGKVEIAWLDSVTGKLSHARLFDVADLDEAAEFAAHVNTTPGCNVYVGAALRKPGTPTDKRTSDADFSEATTLHVDFDDPGAVEAAIPILKANHLVPNLTIVTGRNPNTRAQCWWRLEEPITDPQEYRNILAALAKTLGGDMKVVNPSRVMRLGGTIAWGVKTGRVDEQTEVHPASSARPAYDINQFKTNFPPATVEPLTPLNTSPVGGLPDDEGDPLSVSELVGKMSQGIDWHNNMIRLVAHWVSRGSSDEEILLTAPALTTSGYTVDQTRAEIQTAINGARKKWVIPNPTPVIGDTKPTASFSDVWHPNVVRQTVNLGDWDMNRYVGEPPDITYLCEGTIPLGVPVLVASMGGIGKSFTALNLAWEVCYGNPESTVPWKIMGGPVVAHGSAVMLTAEDGLGTVHRRLAAIDFQNRRYKDPVRLRVVPLPDAGGPMPLVEGKFGEYRTTPAYDDLRRQLLAIDDLRLVVIDPLQAFMLADVNSDPAAGQFMWSVLSSLAADTGATVVVCHHMRKTDKKVSTPGEAREAIRGSTALIDGARGVYAYWLEDETEAKKICQLMNVSFQPDRVINGAIVKTNDDADRGVAIHIREDNGLLRDRTDEINGRQPGGEHNRLALIEGIRCAASEGHPFTKTGQNGVFLRKSELSESLRGVSKNKFDMMVEALLSEGVVVQASAKGAGRGMKWLDIPDGPFARGEGKFAEGARRGKK